MKKFLILALSLLILLGVSVPVFAAQVDPDRLGSITATMVHDGEPVVGGTLTLYRVAELDLSTDSGFRYTEDYADSGVALDSFGASTAVALATYTYENDIEGETKSINANGVVTFGDLEPGLYLLIQWDAADGFYHLAPFLISVPNNEGGEYVYDVTCAPKQDPVPYPTVPEFPTCPSEPTWPSWPTCPSEPEPPTTEPEPPTTEPEPPTTEPEPPTTLPSEPSEEPTTQPTEPKPTEPQLPQTGQNHWPVPVLAVAGLFCIVLGLILMLADKKKHHDA